MNKIVVDATSSLPAWVQIKEQIKLAYTVGRIHEGDVLPSIRSLAKTLRVSDAVVRRAYNELTELGLLSAEPRKHLMVTDSLSRPAHVEQLAMDASEKCDQLVAWSRERGLSAIAIARMFLLKATEAEQDLPTYLYVDASPHVSESFADSIARTWGIPVRGLCVDDVERLTDADLEATTVIVVNAYRHEEIKQKLPRYPRERILPVRVRLHRRLVRRMRRLPGGSAVLFILQDHDASHIGLGIIDYVQSEVGGKLVITSQGVSDIDGLNTLDEDRYRLIVVSGHAWENIPEKVRRLPNVVPSENELIPESLEKARMLAGVLV